MGALVNQLMIYCCCCNEEIKSQILFMLGSAPCWYLIFRYDKADEREVSISFDVDLTFQAQACVTAFMLIGETYISFELTFECFVS